MKFVSSETFMLQGEVGGTPKVFVEFFVGGRVYGWCRCGASE